MSDEINKRPKSGSELINDFFEQLNKYRGQYPCPEVIDVIVGLHNKEKLSNTNMSNALDEIGNKKNEQK